MRGRATRLGSRGDEPPGTLWRKRAHKRVATPKTTRSASGAARSVGDVRPTKARKREVFDVLSGEKQQLKTNNNQLTNNTQTNKHKQENTGLRRALGELAARGRPGRARRALSAQPRGSEYQ